MSIQANPNPVKPDLNIIRFYYETVELEELYFYMYDAMGRMTYREVIMPQAFKENIIEIPNHFSEGIYMVTLKNERGWFETTKLVIN